MAVSSKIEILLYCLLESLDVLTRPTGHALGTVHGMHGLSPSLQERSAYLVRRGLVDSDINAQMRRIYRLTRSGAICALGGIDPKSDGEEAGTGSGGWLFMTFRRSIDDYVQSFVENFQTMDSGFFRRAYGFLPIQLMNSRAN